MDSEHMTLWMSWCMHSGVAEHWVGVCACVCVHTHAKQLSTKSIALKYNHSHLTAFLYKQIGLPLGAGGCFLSTIGQASGFTVSAL